MLARATRAGGRVVTPVSPFYGGYDLARFLDPWHNLWWLYSPTVDRSDDARAATTDWHGSDPRAVYTTLMDTMRHLDDPATPPRGDGGDAPVTTSPSRPGP